MDSDRALDREAPAATGDRVRAEPRPAGAPALVERTLALQRSIGNRATRRALRDSPRALGLLTGAQRLSRQIGWPESKGGPNASKTSPSPGVDRYPIYDPGLGGNTDASPATAGTTEMNDNRAIVLVPQEASGAVHVLLHFHGLQGQGNPGYRNVGGVRDEDPNRDRSDEQFSKSIAEGDKQMVVVMPQGNAAANFGNAVTAPEAYVDNVLVQLANDGGPTLSRSDLIVSGWSAGGNAIAKMADAEAASGTATMRSVALFEGINNFLSKDRVTMGGRDKIDTYLRLIARHLLADATTLLTLSTVGFGFGVDDYLAQSFRFRAYYGAAGAYIASHELLDQGLRQLFGEPVSAAELKQQKQRLPPKGLDLDTVLPGWAALPALISTLPTAVVSQLRSHYQVIKVDQSAKGTVDDSAAAPHMHTLGHNNMIGSGAMLDYLRNTRSLRN